MRVRISFTDSQVEISHNGTVTTGPQSSGDGEVVCISESGDKLDIALDIEINGVWHEQIIRPS